MCTVLKGILLQIHVNIHICTYIHMLYLYAYIHVHVCTMSCTRMYMFYESSHLFEVNIHLFFLKLGDYERGTTNCS